MKEDAIHEELALRILLLARKQISTLVPLLLPAVYALPETARDTPGPLSTDGTTLYYHPQQVVEDFREDRNAPARQLLHVTLHCLLGHVPQRRAYTTPALYDAIADQKVAWFLSCLDLARTKLAGSIPDRETLIPLPHLYQMLVQNRRRCKQYLRYAPDFASDDHSAWSPRESSDAISLCAGGSAAWAQLSGQEEGPDWQRLREQLKEQARSSPTWGNVAGALEQEFAPEAENGLSYTAFLRRFASPKEQLHTDPDSFDPRWYHIGMELYGDIPLLEPSELSEPPLPDDIVLALDTSGSCDGAVCRRFLRETLNLLRDLTTSHHRFHILLLQCDTKIQQEEWLEEEGQTESLLRRFIPKGFGGTDFRPVFQRVETLRRSGQLHQIRGLLYLSDGCGRFPDTAPDYPVAFLLPESRWTPDIPPWVTTLTLSPHDFTIKEASYENTGR